MTTVQTVLADLSFLYMLFFTSLSIIGAPIAAEKRRVTIGTGSLVVFTIIATGGGGLAIFVLWQHASASVAMTIIAILLWVSQAYYITRSIYLIGRRIRFTKLMALREVFLGIAIIVLAAVLTFG